MNSKKAKELRKFLKSIGHGATQVAYVGGEAPIFTRMGFNEHGVLVPDAEGFVTRKTVRGVPRELDDGCGRAIYQEMKRRVE